MKKIIDPGWKFFLVSQKNFWLLKKVGWKATFSNYLKTTWKGPLSKADFIDEENTLLRALGLTCIQVSVEEQINSHFLQSAKEKG